MNGHERGTLSLWQMNGGNGLAPIDHAHAHHGIIKTMVFHPDGPWIYSVGAGRRIRTWEATLKHGLRSLAESEYQEHRIHAFSVSPSGKWLITGSDPIENHRGNAGSGLVKLWSLDHGKPLDAPGSVQLALPQERIISVDISNDGDRIAWGSDSGRIGLIQRDSEFGARRFFEAHLDHRSPLPNVILTPDGHLIAGSYTGHIQIFGIPRRGNILKRLALLHEPAISVMQMALNKQGALYTRGEPSEDKPSGVLRWDLSLLKAALAGLMIAFILLNPWQNADLPVSLMAGLGPLGFLMARRRPMKVAAEHPLGIRA